jgi:hypothetical protein
MIPGSMAVSGRLPKKYRNRGIGLPRLPSMTRVGEFMSRRIFRLLLVAVFLFAQGGLSWAGAAHTASDAPQTAAAGSHGTPGHHHDGPDDDNHPNHCLHVFTCTGMAMLKGAEISIADPSFGGSFAAPRDDGGLRSASLNRDPPVPRFSS